MRVNLLCTLIGLLLLVSTAVAADSPSLPLVSTIFGDQMVLQRGKPNTIWGWSRPGQVVRVEIAGRTARTVTGTQGRWQLRIEPPAPGGPYTLKVVGPQTVVLRDVLVGEFVGDLFMGAATPLLEGGYLFHFNLTGNRQKIGVDDPRLEDRVADNLAKHEITESETLLIGRNFGVVTDIKTGPNGNLFVVSISNGAIYEIFNSKHKPPPKAK